MINSVSPVQLLARVTLVAILAGVAAAQTQSSDIPLLNPFTSVANESVKDIELSGKVIAKITDGDLVQPAFSPDGRVLAYSKVLSSGQFENTEVLLYNSATGKTTVLLNSNKAAKYATYKAFVTEIKWSAPKRLEVQVGDGDVGSTRLIFDPYRKRLLQESSQDELELEPMSPIYRRARQQAVSLFPAFPRAVLDNALSSSSLVIPGKGIVLQKNYAGHDDNIWFLDFQSKSIKSLISLSNDSRRAFNGGLSFESSIFLLLGNQTNSYLFLYRDGKIKGLVKFESTGMGQVEIKHRSPERVVFLVRTRDHSEKGDNPLFVFDGEQLFRVRKHAELYDAAIDPAGRRIAFCYWEGDKRHIVIKQLNELFR
ncbi:MAG TPA: hypothetical protein VFH01_12865 [Pyrinomonadaceae bacterium]|nr:hypothetical protein [Pyrinomonadaceae bacterium]